MQQIMYPKYIDIHEPLIAELYKRGGESKPSSLNEQGLTIYDALADHFGLSEEARSFKIYEDSGAERSKWHNIVRWVRNDLKKLGLLYAPRYGVWALTETAISFVKENDQRKTVVGEGDSIEEVDIETFLKLKANAQEIGDQGEKYVIEYEKQRLKSEGREDLAEKVKRISLVNVGAGYDILSFDKEGMERFVEVKTTIGDGSQFQLTANEYKVAKSKKERYWIYFVRINDDTVPEIHLLNHPAKMQEEGSLLFRPSSYWVTIADKDA
jgi:hypothetical protein